MAITILGSPDTLAPVFNPMYFYVDSNNKNNEGFRYLVQVFSAGTSQELGFYRIAPRLKDGYGVVDINQLLSSKVSFFFDPEKSEVNQSFQDYVNYVAVFGEEYTNYWNFDSINSGGTGGVLSAYTKYSSSVANNFFQSGDTVYFNPVPANPQDYYNGSFVVLSATTSFNVVNLFYNSLLNTGVTSASTAVYDTHSKSQFLGSATASTRTAFNGVLDSMELIDYTGSTYRMVVNPTVPSKFLTNVPYEYHVKPSNKMWLNWHSFASGATYDARINTRYGEYVYTPVGADLGAAPIQTIGVGPNNVSGFTGWTGTTAVSTYPILKNVCWDFDSVFNVAGTAILLNTSGVASPWATYLGVLQNADVFSGQTPTLIQVQPYLAANQVATNIPFSAWTLPSGCIYQKTDYYDFKLYNQFQVNKDISETKRFSVDWSTTRFGNIELVFIDRLGSIISMNFDLNRVKSIDISRSEYQKIIGNLVGNRWQYNSYDVTRQSINTFYKKNLVLNSNWITEAESAYLQELYISANVWIKDNGKFWPVKVINNSYVILAKNNRKNIKIQIAIEMATIERAQNF